MEFVLGMGRFRGDFINFTLYRVVLTKHESFGVFVGGASR